MAKLRVRSAQSFKLGGLQQSRFGAEELEQFFEKPRFSVYVGSPIKLGSDISKERP